MATDVISTTTKLSQALMVYGALHASFRSFKALQKAQMFAGMLAQHNARAATPAERVDPRPVLAKLDKQEVVPLLELWTVLAIVHLFDAYVEFLVSWIPFYGILKVVFVAWLLAPQTRGGEILFQNYVAPQLEYRLKVLDVVVGPAVRGFLLSFLERAETSVMDHTLHTMSDAELRATEASMEFLQRSVAREGYSRARDVSIAALKEAIPDERHRAALLDDILHEYREDGAGEGEGGDGDGDGAEDDGWTDLKLVRSSDGHVRVVVVGGADDDEDDEDEDDNEERAEPLAGPHAD